MQSKLEEKEFIRQLKAGDSKAFSLLVELYGNRVYNTTLGLLQCTEDAEDITQEVFAEIYLSVNSFREEAKISTWIYRIAVQKSLDFLRGKNRKKRKGVVMSIFSKENNQPAMDIPDFHHPGVRMENKELAAILFRAIQKLPEKQQAAFTLHKVEGLSYNEIADIMKSSLSSVESLIFRAKQNLQQLLADYYDNFER